MQGEDQVSVVGEIKVVVEGGWRMMLRLRKMMMIAVMMTEARFCFKTMSEVDVLDDGYKWRK